MSNYRFQGVMPDDRERARKAMERFFTRIDVDRREASGGRDVP